MLPIIVGGVDASISGPTSSRAATVPTVGSRVVQGKNNRLVGDVYGNGNVIAPPVVEQDHNDTAHRYPEIPSASTSQSTEEPTPETDATSDNIATIHTPSGGTLVIDLHALEEGNKAISN